MTNVIHKFTTYLTDSGGKSLTRTVNGVPGILVWDERDRGYTYDEIMAVIDCAYDMEREQFGWSVKFNDGQYKEIFIRSSHMDTINDTTSYDQTINDWIDHIYCRTSKQIELF